MAVLDKQTIKYIEKNKDRIYALTDEQYEKVFADKEQDFEQLARKLAKENVELKVLYDELQEDFSHSLRAGGTYLFNMDMSEFEIIPNIKVLPNNKLKVKGRKGTVTIKAKEKVGKLRGFFKIKQFRAYFVETEGEYTYDPIDETPIEIKKQNEQQLELGDAIIDAGIGTSLMKDIGREKKNWIDYIPHILFFLGVSAALVFLSQYNLIHT